MLRKPVLLFDGDCGFCREWIARWRRLDRDGAVDCVPSAKRHTIAGLPAFDHDALDRAVHLVTPAGTVYTGAGALPVLLEYVPRVRWLASLLRLPGVPWLSDRVYSAIATRRHRLGCGSERCRRGEDR